MGPGKIRRGSSPSAPPRSSDLIRFLVAMAVVAAALAGCGGGGDKDKRSDLPAAPENIEFSTPTFKDGGAIPAANTCDGAGKPPTIVWRALPAGAIELVLVVEDPDAPDGTFTHWTAWGISASTGAGLAPDGQFPAGLKEGKNSAGKLGWTPPCPPKGDDAHHYVFNLYALRADLGLDAGAKPDEVRAAIKKQAVARGGRIGTFKRG
jgi:Raf kinase inhibitor-like YbhB/YbcL family protein